MPLHVRIFIAAMLTPSLKSCFMQEFSRFSRILTGLEGYKILPLETKKHSKKWKNLKKRVFYKKNNKKRKCFRRKSRLWEIPVEERKDLSCSVVKMSAVQCTNVLQFLPKQQLYIVFIHLYSASCSAHQSEAHPVRETQREESSLERTKWGTWLWLTS